jgi:flagellar motor switch protein FliG
MNAIPVTVSAAVLPVSRPQKVALLLLLLDPSTASALLRRFDAGERDVIAAAAETLPSLDTEQLSAIVEEFERDIARGVGPLATGADLKRLIGDIASDAPGRLEPQLVGSAHEPIWPSLAKLKAETLAKYLAGQHPQVSAFILSHLDPVQNADILKLFRAQIRNDVVCRMLTQREPSADVQTVVEKAVREDLIAARQEDEGAHDGIAKVLNQLEKAHSAEVIAQLAQTRPKDAARLKKLLFSFEDVAVLSAKALSLVVDRIPVERLILALNGTDQSFQDMLIGAMSPRARRVAQSELQAMTNIAQGDVVHARRMVVDIVLKLSGEGLITIGEGNVEGASE